jgi:exodeoxyribonuclease VII small subunit
LPAQPQPEGFEAAIAELEQLVAKMEAGDQPLDQALASFERGVQLARTCQAALQEAQQRVQLLTQRAGAATLEDFADGAVQGDQA